MDPLTAISTRATPQIQRAAGLEGARQTPNAAGGYGFELSDETLVRRFLTLGTSGGTYYATQRELTQASAEVVFGVARDRARWLTGEIVTISAAGRAPRPNPAIFALAAAASLGDDDGRRAALDALPLVARTGTHLFLFAGYVEQFRGWGRGLRRAVGEWYLGRDPGALAYQVLKYRQREGWSHRDLLRLAHPVSSASAQCEVFEWIVRGTLPAESPLISAFVEVQSATDTATWIDLIHEHGLSWEMLPDAALSEPSVWEAMISRGIPQTALMRQLPRLTRLGVLSPGSGALWTVEAQLQDADRLRKARVHPVNVLIAQRTYASGRSARGAGQWTPVRQIVDALDAAFYQAFGAIEPAGQRTLLALDVSASMGYSVAGLPISCREASAALALATMATEPDTTVVGFTTASRRAATWATLHRDVTLSPLSISPRQRLDDAIAAVSDLPFGGTDCALPMIWAAEQKLSFDTFVVYTDNETWAGDIHPHQALRRYRERMVPDARLVVAGMTSNDVSIADPQDPGTLDIAGFDSAVPNLIADFSRGDLG